MKCIDVADNTDMPLEVCINHCENLDKGNEAYNNECTVYNKWKKKKKAMNNDNK